MKLPVSVCEVCDRLILANISEVRNDVLQEGFLNAGFRVPGVSRRDPWGFDSLDNDHPGLCTSLGLSRERRDPVLMPVLS